MNYQEKRRTERVALGIPIRVIGSSKATGEFTEDTHTLIVNRSGARIVLKHPLTAGHTVRIVNLENYNEADFRIVGPIHPPGAEIGEWGVECVDLERNIWGIELDAPLSPQSWGALLECRACGQQGFSPVTITEVEVLEASGIITRPCVPCGKPTYWTYADLNRRPRQFGPSEPVAPPQESAPPKKSEKRTHKRVGLKMPILVRNLKGEEEMTKTDNLSKGGVAVSLAMNLMIGEAVTVICPYSPKGENIEQRAEVRLRAKFPFGGVREYGLLYVR